MNAVVLEAVVTCPHCGATATETMPTDACLFFYECRNCRTLLRPKPRGLLRVLLIWLGEVPANTGAPWMLRLLPLSAVLPLAGCSYVV